MNLKSFRLIYIIRPEVSKMRIIAKHINDDLKIGPIRTKRRILCLPYKVENKLSF